MSLITDIAKLQELEQKATCAPWETEENEGGHEIRMGKAIVSRGQHPCHQVIEYEHGCFEDDENDPPENNQAAEAEANAYLISDLRNLAPVMLSVLECFREGDAELIKAAINGLKDTVEGLDLCPEEYDEEIEGLRRLQKAASLMEQ